MKEIAQAFLKAVDIREDSWTQHNPDRGDYTKSMEQAAQEACSNKHMETLVTILLYTAWNDTIDWAKEVLEDA